MYAPTSACGLFFVDPLKLKRNICAASQVHGGRAQLLPSARKHAAISAAVASRMLQKRMPSGVRSQGGIPPSDRIVIFPAGEGVRAEHHAREPDKG